MSHWCHKANVANILEPLRSTGEARIPFGSRGQGQTRILRNNSTYTLNKPGPNKSQFLVLDPLM